MVPTIFPPSAVNRGESVHVRPPELERRPRPPPPAALTVQESTRIPKKRGRKPKLHLHYGKDDGGRSAEPDAKRGRLLEESHGVSKMPRRLHPHGEMSDHSLIQLTKRFQEETTITPKSCSGHRRVGGARLSYSCAFDPDVRSSGPGAHRTSCVSGMTIPQPRKLKHSAEARRHQANECCLPREQPDGVPAKAEALHDSSAGPASSWAPCFTNVDTVTVTDVTMNFLTVTVRESSTDEGFFRGKR